jgi:hypothetical protein
MFDIWQTPSPISVFLPLRTEGHMIPTFALAGLLALTAVGLAPRPASAIPNGLPHANQVTKVEQVRWGCNPWGRCWWRPNYYGAYGFYPVPRFGDRHWDHRG